MSKLVLLSLFLFAVGSSDQVLTAAEKAVLPDSSNVTADSGMPAGPTSFDRIQIDGNSVDSRVCLNIHAFIFKTDDDQVPKLVRETTCMPANSARAKKADGPGKPKLIPATGGNSF